MLLLYLYKRFRTCLISFFNLYELFPVFNCGNNIGGLVNNFFGVYNFNPVPSFTSFSSPSKGGMSSAFCFLNITVSAIDFSGCNLVFSFFFDSINLWSFKSEFFGSIFYPYVLYLKYYCIDQNRWLIVSDIVFQHIIHNFLFNICFFYSRNKISKLM